MALLRRTTTAGSAASQTVTTEDPADQEAGKGRPTPKRSEARKSRRQPVPRNRREADKLRRSRGREQRQEMRLALRTGDERHLPTRDRGPAKRLARDVVDSKFLLGQYSLVLILVLFLLSTANSETLRVAVQILLLVVTVAVVVQSRFVSRQAARLVTERLGADEARGITMYAFWRSLTGRRMRRPPPKVQRGAKV